ncbi:MAG: xanthine dehydrogenase family protein subunit M [Proteobacteria bacterium]|nr:xanthine dehydrogenase family protein subunit M [Pseudomonadota bacterium]
MQNFAFHRPKSLSEAVSALKQADEGKLLSGGQSLIPVMKLNLAAPSDLVCISSLDELRGIRTEAGRLIIGAATTHGEVDASAEVKTAIPALADLAAGIGDPQVRNRGTLGGSIAHNDPAADYPAAVVALDGEIATDRRTIKAEAFFSGMFETALDDDEIIVAVSFAVPDRAAYAKFPNPASRFAVVGVMVAQHKSGTRVAVVGAGANVFRATDMEKALDGSFDPSALDGVAVSADELTTDLQASAQYRAHLVTVMAKRAVAACG